MSKAEFDSNGIAERLRKTMAEKGHTQAELSRYCGVSTAAVAKWCNYGSISYRNAVQAARFLGVSDDWLIKGEGSKESVQVVDSAPIDDPPTPLGSVMTIPALNLKKFLITLPTQADLAERLDVRTSWFYAHKVSTTTPQALRLISAPSDAMAPSIEKGDMVLVDLNQRAFSAPGVYAVEYSGLLALHRIQILPCNRLNLLSDNSSYPSIPIDDIGVIKVIGRCVTVLNVKDL